jgi:hypothetical protein
MAVVRIARAGWDSAWPAVGDGAGAARDDDRGVSLAGDRVRGERQPGQRGGDYRLHRNRHRLVPKRDA